MTFEEWLAENGFGPTAYPGEINFLRATWAKARRLEREACAKTAENWEDPEKGWSDSDPKGAIAGSIRDREDEP